jgi:hypothetical protein
MLLYSWQERSTIRDIAPEMIDKYSNNRLITHFLQPHLPFTITPELIFRDWEPIEDDNDTKNEPPGKLWEAMGMGVFVYNEVWEAYNRIYGTDLNIRSK